jgi:hypothetical protein
LSDFNEKEFSQQILKKKNSKIKIRENTPSARRIILCRRTARRDETNGRFLQKDERHLKSPHFLVAY